MKRFSWRLSLGVIQEAGVNAFGEPDSRDATL
jgi:hypothetical protein